MRIIGCDLHARQQTLAMLDTTTGEVVTMTLKHEDNQVREFYSQLPRPVLVGIEATGSMQWFLNLMEELGIECLVGHPAQIRAAEPRKQKHDRRDADLILKLLGKTVSEDLAAQQGTTRSAGLVAASSSVGAHTDANTKCAAGDCLSEWVAARSWLWSQDGQSKIAALPLAPHAAYRRSELQAMYAKSKRKSKS